MLCNVQKRNKSHKNSLTMNRYANIIMAMEAAGGAAHKMGTREGAWEL